MKRHTHRSGFTLIELLVVISIIGLLVGLTAAGLFRLQAAQREKITNETLIKLHESLDLQFKAVIDRAKQENIPSATMILASGDNVRARVLHVKWRLRQEFPQSFKEAIADSPVDPVYNHKTAYFTYLAGAVGDTPANESAVCLLMVLSQSRGGTTFDPENVGSTSVGMKGIGGKDFKVFVDQTRTPIAFARWTANPAILAEYSNPPYIPAASAYKDPQDPEGKLVNIPAPLAAGLLILFDTQGLQIIHPLGAANNYNRSPIVYAAGKNKLFDDQDDLLSFRLRGSGKGGN